MQNPPDSKQRSWIRRIFTGIAVLAMLGVLGVAVLLGSLWLEHRTEITLPKPTGQFAAGRRLYDWVDDHTLGPTGACRNEARTSCLGLVSGGALHSKGR
jgi:hypothetical protein